MSRLPDFVQDTIYFNEDTMNFAEAWDLYLNSKQERNKERVLKEYTWEELFSEVVDEVG